MNTKVFTSSVLLSLISAVVIVSVGCNQQTTESNGDAKQAAKTSHKTQDESHGGWWCVEHGIPEEQCSMCSSTAAEECKKKGDWCEKHNRAESQCFICDATRANKFAKLYEAKVGRKPPKLKELDNSKQ